MDDNPDVRLHLGDLISQLGYEVEVLGEPRRMLERRHWPEPCVVLLDMRMPELSGLELQSALAKLARGVPIVFISGESQPQEIVQAMKDGAVDFLIKPFGATELTAALERAFERESRLRAEADQRQRLRARYAELSPKEKLVLPLMLLGHSNKSLGERLSIQAGTVKKHRASIYEKFLVDDLSDLITLFKGVEDPGQLWN